jgi:hypothetical protein
MAAPNNADEIFGPQNFLNNVIWQELMLQLTLRKDFLQITIFMVCYANKKISKPTIT